MWHGSHSLDYCRDLSFLHTYWPPAKCLTLFKTSYGDNSCVSRLPFEGPAAQNGRICQLSRQCLHFSGNYQPIVSPTCSLNTSVAKPVAGGLPNDVVTAWRRSAPSNPSSDHSGLPTNQSGAGGVQGSCGPRIELVRSEEIMRLPQPGPLKEPKLRGGRGCLGCLTWRPEAQVST